jgi:hypothetical protein
LTTAEGNKWRETASLDSCRPAIQFFTVAYPHDRETLVVPQAPSSIFRTLQMHWSVLRFASPEEATLRAEAQLLML